MRTAGAYGDLRGPVRRKNVVEFSQPLILPRSPVRQTRWAKLVRLAYRLSQREERFPGDKLPHTFTQVNGLQSKSSYCMAFVPRKFYAFIQLCNCAVCYYLSHIVTSLEM